MALHGQVPKELSAQFSKDMFPNSIVHIDDYAEGLREAGFENVHVEDMTEDWTGFVSQRLDAFLANRSAYETKHGVTGFEALEHFYKAVAGYFESGILAGVRVRAN